MKASHLTALLLCASLGLSLSACRRRNIVYVNAPGGGYVPQGSVDDDDDPVAGANDPSGAARKKRKNSAVDSAGVTAQLSYRACTVIDGQVSACEPGWYQGVTVAYWEEAYHSCKIASGQITTCDGKFFQGDAVVSKDGGYKLCKIVDGQIVSCRGTTYQGPAVVFTQR